MSGLRDVQIAGMLAKAFLEEISVHRTKKQRKGELTLSLLELGYRLLLSLDIEAPGSSAMRFQNLGPDS